jgi:hypothetical protein
MGARREIDTPRRGPCQPLQVLLMVSERLLDSDCNRCGRPAEWVCGVERLLSLWPRADGGASRVEWREQTEECEGPAAQDCPPANGCCFRGEDRNLAPGRRVFYLGNYEHSRVPGRQADGTN